MNPRDDNRHGQLKEGTMPTTKTKTSEAPPQWPNQPHLAIDLAAAVAHSDTAAIEQHRAYAATVTMRESYRAHHDGLRLAAMEALDQARRAPDQGATPTEGQALLAAAVAAKQEADLYGYAYAQDSHMSDPAEGTYGAYWTQSNSTWADLQNGVSVRQWATAQYAVTELDKLDAADVLGQDHPTPHGVTRADIVEAAAPVTRTRARIKVLQAKLDEGNFTGNDMRGMRVELQQLQQRLGDQS